MLLAVLGKQPQLAVQLALMTHCSNAVGGDAASAGSSSTHAAAIGAPMAPAASRDPGRALALRRVSGACRAAVDGPLPGLGACRAAETALGGRAALQHRPNRQAARADPTTETPPPKFDEIEVIRPRPRAHLHSFGDLTRVCGMKVLVTAASTPLARCIGAALRRSGHHVHGSDFRAVAAE